MVCIIVTIYAGDVCFFTLQLDKAVEQGSSERRILEGYIGRRDAALIWNQRGDGCVVTPKDQTLTRAQIDEWARLIARSCGARLEIATWEQGKAGARA